jgi:hypothetical protein
VSNTTQANHAPTNANTAINATKKVVTNQYTHTTRNISTEKQIPKTILQTPKLPTPVKHEVLNELLEGYDIVKRNYLIKGFREGFSIDNDVYHPNSDVNNLKTANDYPDIIDKKLQTEIDLGRLSGPHDEIPLENMVLSPIGLKAKKQPGQFRVIHHLSYPQGNSINSGITKQNSTVKYATVPQAIDKIIKIGKGCFLAKTDIKSAFRIIPVNPKDYNLLGMKWRGKYLYDKVLPF